MPAEIRHVLFSDTEVVMAAATYIRAGNTKLPSGTITGIEFGDSEDLWISLSLIQDKDGATIKYPLDQTALFQALIAYCKERSVPLPAKADKELQIVRGKICLIITMNLPHPKLRDDVEDIRIAV